MDHSRLTTDRAPVTFRPGAPVRVAMPWMASAAALAGLTLLTHAANFGFVVAGGRLLAPADFGTLTALLGIVLVGMAPGMAVQALTAAGVLGAPTVIDRRLAIRLAGVIAGLAAVVLLVVGPGVGATSPVTVLAITAAAGLLPLTGANEGLLQGRARFSTLGLVMVTGAGIKFGAGLVGMAARPTTAVAAAAVGLGYVAQLAASTRASGGLGGLHPDEGTRGAVRTGVVMMGLLLAVIHLDAVLAPLLLGDIDAGRYAVGVTGARVVFWAPQFAILLLYPRLVTDNRRRVVIAAFGGLAAGGGMAAVAANVVGTRLVELAFGSELAAAGAWLWRFTWLGTAALGLQVLTLSDLAAGRRGMTGVLAGLLAAITATLLVVRPASPPHVVTLVAVLMTGAVLAGLHLRLRSPRLPVPTP